MGPAKLDKAPARKKGPCLTWEANKDNIGTTTLHSTATPDAYKMDTPAVPKLGALGYRSVFFHGWLGRGVAGFDKTVVVRYLNIPQLG
jgi:hypothetical protein